MGAEMAFFIHSEIDFSNKMSYNNGTNGQWGAGGGAAPKGGKGAGNAHFQAGQSASPPGAPLGGVGQPPENPQLQSRAQGAAAEVGAGPDPNMDTSGSPAGQDIGMPSPPSVFPQAGQISRPKLGRGFRGALGATRASARLAAQDIRVHLAEERCFSKPRLGNSTRGVKSSSGMGGSLASHPPHGTTPTWSFWVCFIPTLSSDAAGWVPPVCRYNGRRGPAEGLFIHSRPFFPLGAAGGGPPFSAPETR